MTQPTQHSLSKPTRMLSNAIADRSRPRSIESLVDAGPDGLSNAQIGRRLGIYTGHKGHEGHIPRTLLAIMEAEHVVEQDNERKLWRLTG